MPASVDLSVIVVSWNTRAILRDCLRALFHSLDELPAPSGSLSNHRLRSVPGRRSPPGDPLAARLDPEPRSEVEHSCSTSEVIVVDNGSSDGSAALVRREFPRARLVANRRNLGYARAANQGLAAASGRYRCLINSDALASGDALARLVRFLDETTGAAAVTPQLLDANGRRQNSFDAFPDLFTELVSKTLARRIWPGRYPSKRLALEAPTPVDLALGACFVARASALAAVGGGFDEDYFFFQEDADLCLRLRRAGFGVYVLPEATAVHLSGRSKANAVDAAHIEYQRSMYIFFRKHRGRAAYLVLRALRPLKVFLDLASAALLVAGTLGLARRARRNLRKYWSVFAWHLRLCPAGAGLAALEAPEPASLLDEEVADHQALEPAAEEHR